PPHDRRLIPALAGNTARPRGGARRWPAHPRARGEHSSFNEGRPASVGSSPRSRGTLAVPTSGEVEQRLIPALAGNTGPRARPRARSSAHPRARGEHVCLGDERALQVGSSPRSRGTRTSCWRSPTGPRLIPALAGNTPLLHSGPA